MGHYWVPMITRNRLWAGVLGSVTEPVSIRMVQLRSAPD